MLFRDLLIKKTYSSKYVQIANIDSKILFYAKKININDLKYK